MQKINILLILLFNIMIIMSFTLFVAAEEKLLDSGSFGSNISWTIYENGSMKLEGSGEIQSSGWGRFPWADYKNFVKNISFSQMK